MSLWSKATVYLPEQEKWLQALRRGGYEAEVAWGWEEARDAVMRYLGGEWPEVDLGEMGRRILEEGKK